MKKYFKKFGIMFVMILAVIGFSVIQHGTMANAATVGQELAAPESGWTRYDDTDNNIKYSGNWSTTVQGKGTFYKNTYHSSLDKNSLVKFDFYGTKLRIIAEKYQNRSNAINITIDGKSETYSQLSSDGSYMPLILLYEKLGLSKTVHEVTIQSSSTMTMDAIDMDEDGYLIDPNESILLSQSAMNLNVGDSQQLTATTTPAAVGVTWTSSDPSIASVDSNGNVTGVKEGTCTVTATTADGLTATCTVTVSKEDESISLNKSTTNLTAGDSETLVATTTPSAVNVTWSSSDTSVATVDSTGKVTAVGAGTATITATTTDGSNLSASCMVNVTANSGGNTGGTTTGASAIVNIAYAKGNNTNNAGGDVSIIFNGVPDTTLSVVKTASVKSVWVGDTFTYTIVVTNTGSKTAKAVVINDSAPNHIQFMPSGITTTQGTVDPSSSASNIVVNVGDIPPAGTVTITVPATVVL